MTDLKTRISRGEYEIDSREVAGAIIAKLRTVNRVRTRLEGPGKPRPGTRMDRSGPRSDLRRAVFRGTSHW